MAKACYHLDRHAQGRLQMTLHAPDVDVIKDLAAEAATAKARDVLSVMATLHVHLVNQLIAKSVFSREEYESSMAMLLERSMICSEANPQLSDAISKAATLVEQTFTAMQNLS
jgi:hypothetical protein